MTAGSSAEADFVARLRALAVDPAARGLLDDAAVLGDLVLTTDMIAEGVHFLGDDPPETVARKLVAANLSDLAAKGATPLGILLGYTLSEPEWDRGFLDGLGAACARWATPLLGGDTIRAPARILSLTAIGRAPECGAPDRRGARAGDTLWVSGTVGDAGLGLALARDDQDGPEPLLARYRTPEPRLAAGRALAPLVTAMTDVSDGLLIDTARLATASGLAATIDLETVPLSDEARAMGLSPLDAATSGDDYELLFAAADAARAGILSLSQSLGLSLTAIGRLAPGEGLSIVDARGPVPLPERLGYEHRR